MVKTPLKTFPAWFVPLPEAPYWMVVLIPQLLCKLSVDQSFEAMKLPQSKLSLPANACF